MIGTIKVTTDHAHDDHLWCDLFIQALRMVRCNGSGSNGALNEDLCECSEDEPHRTKPKVNVRKELERITVYQDSQ